MSDSVFQYKYVLVDEEGSIEWEVGVNRIADLNILPQVKEVESTTTAGYSN